MKWLVGWRLAVAVLAATTAVVLPNASAGSGTAPSSHARATLRQVPALDPSQFADLASGVVLLQSLTCAGRPTEEGTGFLVGDRVVMTARHVVKTACHVRALVGTKWVAADGWSYWHHSLRNDTQNGDVATIRLHTPSSGHVFALRTWSPSVGTNLAAIGHPLGNELSITQGRVFEKGTVRGIPLLAVRLLGAEGGSGSPLVDGKGNVVGILQQGLGGTDALGQRTSGLILGVDLASWWPTAKLDLCRAYPAGGIPGCGGATPPPSSSCDLVANGSCTGFDLSGGNFAGVDLDGIDFSGSDLSHADLSGANLSGAVLVHADLTGANLAQADLSLADLAGATFDPSQLATAYLCKTLLADGVTYSGCGYGALTP